MKVGIKQSAASAAVFVGVLAGVASVDERVRDHFLQLFDRGSAVPMITRFGDVGDALLGAARTQSIENAPLVVFAAVSAVLVLFMWRT